MAEPSPLSPAERRERTRAHKQAFAPLGVVAVRNTVSGRVWTRASRNVDGTLNRIRFELQLGTCRNRGLAAEWQRDGAGAFRFEVVERVKQRDDPDFDYEAELQTLLTVWTEELQGEPA